MRVFLYLVACCLVIAGCAWIGFELTGLLFRRGEWELGSSQIGQFIGAFIAGTAGFMAVTSLSMAFSKKLTIFFSPFGEMNE